MAPGANQRAPHPIAIRTEKTGGSTRPSSPSSASSRPKGIVERAVRNKHFESCSALVICLNALVIGMGTEHRIAAAIALLDPERDEGATVGAIAPLTVSSPATLTLLGYIFASLYVVELLLKLFVYRRQFFTDHDWRWNCFDLFLVLATFYENVSDLVAAHPEGGGSFMSLLRLLRLLKLLRLVRLMRFFKELRTMFLCIVGSVRTLFWTVVMLLLIMYLFGLCLLQGAVTCASTPSCSETEPIRESLIMYWGSVGGSMITLFKAITGGQDWENMVGPMQEAGLFYFAIFLFYILFLSFAVLNVLTGMFVDTAMAVLMGLKEEGSDIRSVQQDLKDVLDSARGEGEEEGCLSMQTLVAHATTREMQIFLLECDVELEEVLKFFAVVSCGSDEVGDLDAFLNGCRNITGDLQVFTNHVYLEGMTLGGCKKITGDLKVLANLVKLEEVDLRGCSNIVGNIQNFTNLIHLEDVDLRGCTKITGDLQVLTNFAHLKCVSLNGCRTITGDIDVLNSLAHLIVVNLGGCCCIIGDLRVFTCLFHVKWVYLGGCKHITGNLHALSNLVHLEKANLDGCKNTTGNIQALNNLVHLKWVNLGGCENITGNLQVLSNLIHVEMVNLYGCKMITGNLQVLSNLFHLKWINLGGCEDTTGDLQFLTNLVYLVVVNLNGCQGITGNFRALSNLNRLENVSLDGCRDIKGDFQVFDNLRHLERVHVDGYRRQAHRRAATTDNI